LDRRVTFIGEQNAQELNINTDIDKTPAKDTHQRATTSESSESPGATAAMLMFALKGKYKKM